MENECREEPVALQNNECVICFETYDEENRRRVNLECGHHHCFMCNVVMAEYRFSTCAQCRKPLVVVETGPAQGRLTQANLSCLADPGWDSRSAQSKRKHEELDVRPKCGCGRPSVKKVVKRRTRNRGREFWGCSRWPEYGYCNFFQWADDEEYSESE